MSVQRDEIEDVDCRQMEDQVALTKVEDMEEIQTVHQGVPISAPAGATTVVVVEQPVTDDCIPACLGTSCLGLLGLGLFACFCNTPTGRVGAATGCMVNGALFFVIYLIVFILYLSHHCDDIHNSRDPVCHSMVGQGIRIVLYMVLGVMLFSVSLRLRMKYVKELKEPRVANVQTYVSQQ